MIVIWIGRGHTGAMEQPSTRPSKAELVRRIELSRATLEARIRSVPTAELTEPVGEGGWSVKDHLAHVAAWERSLVELLEGRPRHAAVDATPEEFANGDHDQLNDKVCEARRRWTLAAVLTDFESVHDELMEVLDHLSDEDLQRSYSSFQPDSPPDDRPVIGWIDGNTFEHFDDHREAIERILESQKSGN